MTQQCYTYNSKGHRWVYLGVVVAAAVAITYLSSVHSSELTPDPRACAALTPGSDGTGRSVVIQAIEVAGGDVAIIPSDNLAAAAALAVQTAEKFGATTRTIVCLTTDKDKVASVNGVRLQG